MHPVAEAVLKYLLLSVAVACGLATAFFLWFGARSIHFALTFDGEGSLGHVGVYIAAYLFPLLALLFGGFTILAWKRFQKMRHS
jgi:hypothetical protein